MKDKELRLECLKLAYQEELEGLNKLETAVVYFGWLIAPNHKLPSSYNARSEAKSVVNPLGEATETGLTKTD